MLSLALSLLLVVQEDETAQRVETLARALTSEKGIEATSAAMELASLGSSAKGAIPALRQAMKAKAFDLRGLAAAALIVIDQAEAGKAFPVFIDSFKHPGAGLLHLNLLAVFGNRVQPTRSETVEGFLKLASEDNPIAWILADTSLGRIEKGRKDLIPPLEAVMKEKPLRARVMAARHLGRIDASQVKDAVTVLRGCLNEANLDFQIDIAEDLVELDSEQGKYVIDVLTPHLKDKDALRGCRIGIFLVGLDAGQAEKVLPVVDDALKAADVSATISVLRMLVPSLLKKPDRFKHYVPALETLLASKDRSIRSETLQRVGELGPVALPLEKQFREASKEREASIALPAIEALIRVKPDKGASLVPQLIEWAEKRDKAAKGARDLLDLLEKLKLLQPPGSEEDWGASMGEQIEQRKRRVAGEWHREELLRLHSIVELGDLKSKGKRGVPALITVVKERTNGDIVRGQAAFSLGRIGRPSVAAIPVLLKISKDETEAPDVRLAAREAMKMIDRDLDQ